MNAGASSSQEVITAKKLDMGHQLASLSDHKQARIAGNRKRRRGQPKTLGRKKGNYMIYLKFVGRKDSGEGVQLSRTISTEQFFVVDVKGYRRVYHKDSEFTVVSDDDWLNCFVVSADGKTIDVIRPLEEKHAKGGLHSGGVTII